MPNPNAPKTHLERVEDVLAEMTPKPASFAWSHYPVEEVRSDERVLEALKRSPFYRRDELNGERTGAKLLEKTFMDAVELDDWFAEEELYGDDPEYDALTTFPAAEVDDAFNHIDMIGVVRNEATGHQAVPFAIDLTYNTDPDKMRQKFTWRHVYGKSEAAPAEASEFGEIGRTLRLHERLGLKIPGFATAKYFEDLNDPMAPRLPKGRITVMPRFVVGYNPDLVDALTGAPADREAYVRRYGERAYQDKMREYQQAKRCARWCTLLECAEQAADLHEMMDGLGANETRQMCSEELAMARQQIAALDGYFQRALVAARQDAQAKAAAGDTGQLSAMEYASRRDEVCRAIRVQSTSVFLHRAW